jgi:hypothetical protein
MDTTLPLLHAGRAIAAADIFVTRQFNDDAFDTSDKKVTGAQIHAFFLASTLTGFSANPGTVSASDSILTAFEKIVGNMDALVTGVSSVNGQTGDVELTTDDIPSGASTQQFTNADAEKLASIYVPADGNVTAANTNLAASDTYLTLTNRTAAVQTNLNGPPTNAVAMELTLDNLTSFGWSFTAPVGNTIYWAGLTGTVISFSDLGASLTLHRAPNSTDIFVHFTTSGAITLG